MARGARRITVPHAAESVDVALQHLRTSAEAGWQRGVGVDARPHFVNLPQDGVLQNDPHAICPSR
eukprot:3334190-Alexandrium_andersonii.AAC.1